MQNSGLPPPTDQKMLAIRREDLNDQIQAPFQELAHLDDLLTDVIARQRSSFATKSTTSGQADDQNDDIDAPPDPDARMAKDDDLASNARFAESTTWRRPSDYVAYMAKRFEDEWTNPRTKRQEPRPLKRDQVLFIAQFAHACNTV